MSTRRRRTNSGRDHGDEPTNGTYTSFTNSYSQDSGFSTDTTPLMMNYGGGNMSGRDRTKEFLSAVKSMQSRRMVGISCLFSLDSTNAIYLLVLLL